MHKMDGKGLPDTLLWFFLVSEVMLVKKWQKKFVLFTAAWCTSKKTLCHIMMWGMNTHGNVNT